MTAVATDDAKNALAGSYDIGAWLRDVNSAPTYSTDVAAMGYIADDQHLILPTLLNYQDDLGGNPFDAPADVAIFMQVNYDALVRHGIKEDAADFLTQLRYFVVTNGAVAADLEKRSVTVDEYTMLEIMDDQKMDYRPDRDTGRWLRTHWAEVVGVVMHVFWVRGHHYHESYDELYTRTWNSTTVEVPRGVKMPSWEIISRSGLHCFGIRPLRYVIEQMLNAGKLSQGLQIRWNATPAGAAPIKTGYAVLKAMQTETWWPAFESRYGTEIKEVHDAAAAVDAAGVEAHIFSKLYDPHATFVRPDLSAIDRLGAWLVGYVNSLPRNASLQKQKALDKHVGAFTSRAGAFQAMLERARDSAERGIDLVAFIQGSTDNNALAEAPT